MSKVDAIVVLLPTCLEVARLSGGSAAQAERFPLGDTTLEAAWSQSLRPLDHVLPVALQKIGVGAGARLRFIYRSPDSVVEAIHLKAGKGDLSEAARLALAESTSFPWSEAISDIQKLKTGEANGAWYLGVADRRANVDLLDALATRNGYRVADAVPNRAALLDSLIRRFHASSDPHARCLLELGAASSAILTAHQGRITSLRCVDLGYDAFVEAVMRSHAARKDEGFAYEAAAAIIAKIGLLPRGDVSAASNGAVDDSMKPLMRAAVQRLVVEVRQTIRFGIPESDAPTCHIEVGGPGASIPDLAATLSTHTDLEVVCAPGGADLAGAPCAHMGATLGHDAASLVPAAEDLRRQRRLMRNSLIAGGVLALGLLAYEGITVSASLSRERDVLSEREATVNAIRGEIEARRQAGIVSKDLARLEKGVVDAAGESTPWRAVFRELSSFTELYPVRLTDLSTSTVPGGASLNLKGIVFLDQGAQVDPLSQFIESLQRSPLVAGVEVGATRRLEIEGRAAKQFSISAQVRGVRAERARSAAVTESTP
ncbi:MAG: hypothetical protein JNL50_03350 [Phycisphaerae bacterium]|nr:hypothetical protein [Phycisphaerae bacterium]